MAKIIIENNSVHSMEEALDYVKSVILMGKVSETSKGEQYCFVTSWKDGTVVYAYKNTKSDRFRIETCIKK